MRRRWFHLAWHCGYPHPDLMLRAIDSRQYTEIVAMMNLEPCAAEREDIRAGTLATVIANGNPYGKKVWRASDFMRDWDYRDAAEPVAAVDVSDQVKSVFGAIRERMTPGDQNALGGSR